MPDNHTPQDATAQAAQTLIEAAQGFYTKNWMLGTSGNLSIRIPEEGRPLQYLVTASGRDKGALTPADFVLVGEGGHVLHPPNALSSAETLLHEAVYRQYPDINAVYHVHTVTATLLSQQLPPGTPLSISNLEMLKGLGQTTHETTVHLPVVDNTQDIATLSRTLAQHLNPAVPGFILRGHGLYTWGKTPTDAKRHIEIWEFLFQYKLNELLLLRA